MMNTKVWLTIVQRIQLFEDNSVVAYLEAINDSRQEDVNTEDFS
jgi:hypothetical protein